MQQESLEISLVNESAANFIASESVGNITKGMTPEEAEAFIKSKRPAIHIEGVQREALQKFYDS